MEECAGPEFPSCIGVKQACCLSLTLFGGIIDRLCFCIASRSWHLGSQLSCGRRMPVLLYADDFALLSMGPLASAQMHSLLSQVDEFNAPTRMKANTGVGKTEMMMFGMSPERRSTAG